jgi:hypothetical protein
MMGRVALQRATRIGVAVVTGTTKIGGWRSSSSRLNAWCLPPRQLSQRPRRHYTMHSDGKMRPGAGEDDNLGGRPHLGPRRSSGSYAMSPPSAAAASPGRSGLLARLRRSIAPASIAVDARPPAPQGRKAVSYGWLLAGACGCGRPAGKQGLLAAHVAAAAPALWLRCSAALRLRLRIASGVRTHVVYTCRRVDV